MEGIQSAWQSTLANLRKEVVWVKTPDWYTESTAPLISIQADSSSGWVVLLCQINSKLPTNPAGAERLINNPGAVPEQML